jgi:ribose 5-phosphate isomerase B
LLDKYRKIMKLAIACDHAGFIMKKHIKNYLLSKGYEIKDFGADSEESSDYADFAHPMALSIEQKEYDFGISMCGSGNGINMAANKHRGIRSALCWEPEIARLARSHNDANICALPARFITPDKAEKIVDTFLNTTFDGGRHQRRIDKIPL